MKKHVIILSIAVISLFGTNTALMGQEVKEQKVQSEKEIQEKLQEEKAKQEQFVLEKQVAKGEVEKAIQTAREAYIDATTRAGTGLSGVYLQDGPGYIFVNGSSQSSTSMDFSKTMKEASFEKDFTFSVEKDAKRASISISGMCDSGEVRIKITMPDGKTYTEVLIDEYGNVNWSKSFTISEEDTSKAGDWKFGIDARDATGVFRISVKSY